MTNDAEALYRKLCKIKGFEKEYVDGATVLTDPSTGRTFRIVRTRTGRYLVTPSSTDGDGQVDPVVFSGSFGRGPKIKNVFAQLADMGLEIREGHIQRNAKKEKTSEPSQLSETPADAAMAANTPEVAMNKLAPADPADPIDELLEDKEFTTEFLRQAVQERAVAAHSPLVYERGVAFRDWEGDLYDVIRATWITKPGAELPVEPSETQLRKLLVELQPFMRRQHHALRLNVDPRNGGKMIWRVRVDSTSDADVSTAPTSTATQGEVEPMPDPTIAAPSPVAASPRPPVPVPAPPSVPRPAPVPVQPVSTDDTDESTDVKVYVCEARDQGCKFADASMGAVIMHQNKHKDTPHPTESFPCPHCRSVRSGVYGYRKHLGEAHADLYEGKTMCQKTDCLQWFDGGREYRKHLAEAHPQALSRARKPASLQEAPQEALESRQPVVQPTPKAKPAPPPKAASRPTQQPPAQLTIADGDISMEAVQQAALKMISEYPELKAENERLQKELYDLRIKVKELERFQKKIQAMLPRA